MAWWEYPVCVLFVAVYLAFGANIVRIGRARFDPMAIPGLPPAAGDETVLPAMKILATLLFPLLLVMVGWLMACCQLAALVRWLSHEPTRQET